MSLLQFLKKIRFHDRRKGERRISDRRQSRGGRPPFIERRLQERRKGDRRRQKKEE